PVESEQPHPPSRTSLGFFEYPCRSSVSLCYLEVLQWQSKGLPTLRRWLTLLRKKASSDPSYLHGGLLNADQFSVLDLSPFRHNTVFRACHIRHTDLSEHRSSTKTLGKPGASHPRAAPA